MREDMLTGLLALWRQDRALPCRDHVGGYSISRPSAGASRSKPGSMARHLSEHVDTSLGRNDSLALSASAAFDLPGAFTLFGWVFVEAFLAESGYILANWGLSGNYVLGFGVTGTTFCSVKTTATTESATQPAGTITTGTWHLVVGWFDPSIGTHGAVFIQANNGPVVQTTLTAARVPSTNDLYTGSLRSDFGSAQARFGMRGIYKGRVLTQSERDWLWNDGRGNDPLAVRAPRVRRGAASGWASSGVGRSLGARPVYGMAA